MDSPSRSTRTAPPAAADLAVGIALVLFEGLAYLGVVFAVGLQQWGADGYSGQDHLYLAETAHWTTGLIITAVVLAGLAAWRRAPRTAVLQLAAAMALLVLLAQAGHHYDVTHPKPVPPYTGPICRSGHLGGCP